MLSSASPAFTSENSTPVTTEVTSCAVVSSSGTQLGNILVCTSGTVCSRGGSTTSPVSRTDASATLLPYTESVPSTRRLCCAPARPTRMSLVMCTAPNCLGIPWIQPRTRGTAPSTQAYG